MEELFVVLAERVKELKTLRAQLGLPVDSDDEIAQDEVDFR